MTATPRCESTQADEQHWKGRRLGDDERREIQGGVLRTEEFPHRFWVGHGVLDQGFTIRIECAGVFVKLVAARDRFRVGSLII